jgi:hypothetical protein
VHARRGRRPRSLRPLTGSDPRVPHCGSSSPPLTPPSLDPLAEPGAPALRKHVELGGASHALDVVAVTGEKACDLGHPEAARVPLELDDRVSRGNLAFAGHGEVEAEEPSLEKLGHELVSAHLDPQREAGESWLGYDELGRADPEAAADADIAVEEAFGGQILAESARAEVELRPLARPELVEL